MSDARLYEDFIMEHIKNARNYRVLDDADRTATGSNPLCGDDMLVYLKMDGQRIADAAFQCTCCGISMASASIMTEMVKGRLAHDVKALLRDFVAMINTRTASATQPMSAERLAMLETIKRFPARTRCAALPWMTLQGALDCLQDAVVVPAT